MVLKFKKKVLKNHDRASNDNNDNKEQNNSKTLHFTLSRIH